jgi:mannose-6-phosphate isomerase-like protein (cupin superfamily)
VEQLTAAEFVVPCPALDETLGFFTRELGWRVEAIFPADDPQVAVVSGLGTRLRLDARASGDPGTLRIHAAGRTGTLTAPNGTRIELVDDDAPLAVPALAPSLVITRMTDDAPWVVGRAGMRYRDLIPGRQGGRFIASHIVIPDAGPVPDYVHFHVVRFQMIFCRRGWVRLVYEDQGEPFVLHAGDCVLQPPRIRHRVLESSGGVEVIEVGCPAEHETRVDHDLPLPTAQERPDRDFSGQRFVRHVAAGAPWHPWHDGYDLRDTGIGTATVGLAGARVIRPGANAGRPVWTARGELELLFVLDGSVQVRIGGEEACLRGGDSVVVPDGMTVELGEASADLELLEVSLPAAGTS